MTRPSGEQAASVGFLPYGRQAVDEDDIAAVVRVLQSDWLTTGPAVDAFEEEFARKVGAPFARACSSATAALHLAMMALDLGSDDVAIVPAMTFVATANAARYCGAEVIFADVDPGTGLMSPESFRAAVAQGRTAFPRHRLKVALPVHLNGQPCDMKALAKSAAEAGITLVEDACHALGGYLDTQRNEPVGSCNSSSMAVFSGHPVKTIAMGEGGLITTRSRALAERLARLRSHGINRDPSLFQVPEQAFAEGTQPHPWYHELGELGFNYRSSDIHCALGLSQLRKLEGFVTQRAQICARYRELLAPMAPAIVPIGLVGSGSPAWHLFVVHIEFEEIGISRDIVMSRLKDRGIGSQVHYLPVNRQPYYRKRYGFRPLPGAEAYYARCLSLPLHVRMSATDVDQVVDALATAISPRQQRA